MKSRALIYCAEDGEAAKAISLDLRKSGKYSVTLCSAYEFQSAESNVDRVIVMPSVPRFYRDRIMATYGDIVDGPAKAALTAKHRGRGRFFVMRGDEIVSGPHTKDEAQRLAAA